MTAAAPLSSGGDSAELQKGRAVFVSDFVHIAVPFDDLVPVLLDKDMAWLRRLEDPSGFEEEHQLITAVRERASGDGERAGGRAHPPEIGDSGGAPSPAGDSTTGESAPHGAPPSPSPGAVAVLARIGPGRMPSQPVWITAGPSRRHEHGVIVPIRWEPGRLERLLPTLEADLELSHLDGPYSRLGISGRYRVPLAQVGWRLDRVALRRVAESTLRRFLRQAEAAIVAER